MGEEQPVTFINIFELSASDVAAFRDGWDERLAVMRRMPGFIEATLYEATSPDTRFQLVNVAHWQNSEHLDRARGNRDFRAAFPTGGPPVVANGGLYRSRRPADFS